MCSLVVFLQCTFLLAGVNIVWNNSVTRPAAIMDFGPIEHGHYNPAILSSGGVKSHGS